MEILDEETTGGGTEDLDTTTDELDTTDILDTTVELDTTGILEFTTTVELDTYGDGVIIMGDGKLVIGVELELLSTTTNSTHEIYVGS